MKVSFFFFSFRPSFLSFPFKTWCRLYFTTSSFFFLLQNVTYMKPRVTFNYGFVMNLLNFLVHMFRVKFERWRYWYVFEFVAPLQFIKSQTKFVDFSKYLETVDLMFTKFYFRIKFSCSILRHFDVSFNPIFAYFVFFCFSCLLWHLYYEIFVWTTL